MSKQFLIDDAIKNGDIKFQKGRGTDLVISTLRRANSPLSMREIDQRIRRTKSGKALEVKSVAGRVAKTLGHFTKTNPLVRNEDGKFSLIEA